MMRACVGRRVRYRRAVVAGPIDCVYAWRVDDRPATRQERKALECLQDLELICTQKWSDDEAEIVPVFACGFLLETALT